MDSKKIYDTVHQAVVDGDFATVKELITLHGVSLAAEWADGYNLLYTASELKHTEISKFLLSSGCKVNCETVDNTNTPFHFAVANDPELVHMFVKKGANVSAKGYEGHSPLHIAVANNDPSISELLIKMGANVDAVNDNNETPLLVAASKGNNELVELLLNHKANVNAQRKDGKTAIHIAIEQNNVALFQLLLSKDSDLNTQDENGNTPLHSSVIGTISEPFFKTLLEKKVDVNKQNSEGKTALHITIEKNWLAAVFQLLFSHAHVDIGDLHGQTPLHLIVERGDMSLVANFLKHGQQGRYALKSECKLGLRPLDVAIKLNKTPIAELLVKAGAKASKKFNNRRTPLLFAVESKLAVLVDKALKDLPDKDQKGNRLAFYAALKSRNPEIINKFVQYGFHVIPEDTADDEIIRYAIESGDVKILEDLVNNGFNPKKPVISGPYTKVKTTTLHLAAEHGRDVAVAKFLIDSGLDVNAKDTDGKPPIYYSARYGDVKTIRLFLDSNADIADVPEVLSSAVKAGDIDLVKSLLSKGVVIEEDSLYWTASGKNEETQIAIAKLLLSRGANVNATPEKRSGSKNDWTFRYTNEDASALHRSAEFGLCKLAEFLLQNDADVNIKNANLETPLHVSVRAGDSEMTRLLLQKGADLEAITRHGYTALHMAVDFNRPKVVEILLNAGANLEAKDEAGCTPLSVAATGCDEEQAKLFGLAGTYLFKKLKSVYPDEDNCKVVSLLLEKGSDLNSCNNEGQTPLHISSEKGFAKFVTQILNKGAKIDVKNQAGKTPLALAAVNKKDAVVEILLKNGAKNDVTDHKNRSAIHIACRKTKNIKVVELLLEKALNIDSQDSKKRTPAQIALQKGNADVVQALLQSGTDVNVIGGVLRKAIDTVMDERYLPMMNFDLGRNDDDHFDFEDSDYYDASDDEDNDFGAARTISVRLFQRHIFMMRAVGMQLCEKLLIDPLDDDVMEIFRKSYKKELLSMKIVPIGNSKLTYLSFLRKNVQELTSMIKKGNISEVLKGGEYKNRFPKFASLISCHFRQAENRLELIGIVTKYFSKISPILPEECIREVSRYLTNCELYDFSRSLAEIFDD